MEFLVTIKVHGLLPCEVKRYAITLSLFCNINISHLVNRWWIVVNRWLTVGTVPTIAFPMLLMMKLLLRPGICNIYLSQRIILSLPQLRIDLIITFTSSMYRKKREIKLFCILTSNSPRCYDNTNERTKLLWHVINNEKDNRSRSMPVKLAKNLCFDIFRGLTENGALRHWTTKLLGQNGIFDVIFTFFKHTINTTQLNPLAPHFNVELDNKLTAIVKNTRNIHDNNIEQRGRGRDTPF